VSHSEEKQAWPPTDDDGATRAPRHLTDDHELTRGLLESVNHHLRTPLTVVLCRAELLVEQQHELPAEVNESITALLRAARRLNEVVVGVCDLVATTCVDPKTSDTIDIATLAAAWSRRIGTVGPAGNVGC
jgi:light-regulated signal transduction histidine kinase (bacteriophytochrome)